MILHPEGYCLIDNVLKTEFYVEQEARDAIVDWLDAHGIDPAIVPVRATVIVDDTTISYTRYVLGEDGRPVPAHTSGGIRTGCKIETAVVRLDHAAKPWPEVLRACPLLADVSKDT